MARRGRGGSPFSLFSFQDIITCVSGIIILITLVLAVELSQRKQGSPQLQTAKVASQLRHAIADAQAEIARLEAEVRDKTDGAQQAGDVSASAVRHDLFVANEQIKSLQADATSLRKQQQALADRENKLNARRFDHDNDRRKRAAEENEVKQLQGKLSQVRQNDQVFYHARTADGKQVWLVQIEGARTLVAPANSNGGPRILSQGASLSRQSDFEKWLSNRSNTDDFLFLLVRPEGIAEFSVLKQQSLKQGFSLGFDLLSQRQSALAPEKTGTSNE